MREYLKQVHISGDQFHEGVMVGNANKETNVFLVCEY